MIESSAKTFFIPRPFPHFKLRNSLRLPATNNISTFGRGSLLFPNMKHRYCLPQFPPKRRFFSDGLSIPISSPEETSPPAHRATWKQTAVFFEMSVFWLATSLRIFFELQVY